MGPKPITAGKNKASVFPGRWLSHQENSLLGRGRAGQGAKLQRWSPEDRAQPGSSSSHLVLVLFGYSQQLIWLSSVSVPSNLSFTLPVSLCQTVALTWFRNCGKHLGSTLAAWSPVLGSGFSSG